MVSPRLIIISLQCRCGVFRIGGPGLEAPGVLLVDPSDQNVVGVATSGVHHLEEEEVELDQDGGQSHVLVIVQ